MRVWTSMTIVGLSLVGCVRAWSPPLECETDAECTDGQRCLATKYEADSYYGDQSFYRSGTYQFACTARQRCGPAEGGCGQGEICDLASGGGACVVPECSREDSSACGGFSCDFGTKRCRTTCDESLDSDQCAAGHYCEGTVCRAFECGGDPREVCGGFACVEGVCRASCASDDDCLAGYSCTSGVCRGSGTDGVSCERSADCAETHYCDDYYSACEALREGGASCSSSEECASGSCVEDYFYESYSCAYLAVECVGCSSAQYCDETTGACEPKRAAGAPCEFSEECVTDTCLYSGLCAAGYGDDCSEVDCAIAFTCTYEYDYYEGDLFYCQ